MAEPLVIGVDVGGTKILAGVVDRDGNVVRSHEVVSPSASEEDVLATLDSSVSGLLADGVAAIGYGVPANLARGTARILGAANLPLDDYDLSAHATEAFGLPAGVENDANAAALAEWRLGAGRGLSNLLVLTLGTGVGGGIVIDGRLFRGWAELGHIVVQEGGELCTCGGHGHLEVLASGSAGDRIAQELWGADADAHALVDRAEAGDTAARAALARIGRSLGAAIASLVNVLDPELVVVGGGFGAAAGDFVLEPAREAARADAIFPANRALRIVAAELGSDAGLVGAGLVAFEALDGVR